VRRGVIVFPLVKEKNYYSDPRVNRFVAAVAQRRQVSPVRRYCATTVATSRLSVATMSIL
jgi:hypothetical protein